MARKGENGAMAGSTAGRSDLTNPSGAAEGSKPAPGLYLVATPIGNLGDITARGTALLASADLIACEDSRVTGRLLSLLGLPARPLLPYHEHNAEKVRPVLMAKLKAGAVVALVSDAGMPLLSDPGYRLVQDCLAEAVPVTSLPGAAAALVALQLSGLPCHRFLFEGFLPARTQARRRQLQELAPIPATLIFYESPQRLADSLADMRDVLGERNAAVARELTKLHEEVRRGTLAELAAHYTEKGPPKGELAVVVGPPAPVAPATEEDIDRALATALETMSPRDAAAAVAAAQGHPRRAVYARALVLAGKRGG